MKSITIIAFTVGIALGARAQLVDPPLPEVTSGGVGMWDLAWEGKAGRSFFIQHSEDLENWYYYPVVEFGYDEEIIWTFDSSGSEFFVRLVYTDEPVTGDPGYADFDLDGISNIDEITLHGTNPVNPDSDGDGVTDGGEYDQGFDPTDPSNSPDFEAIMVVTGGQNVPVVQRRTITIPPGNKAYLLTVAVQSFEHPDFTDPGEASEYNDYLTWSATISNSNPVTGAVDVNSLHGQFQQAEMDGVSFLGLWPAHIPAVEVVQADADTPVTIELDLSATNVADANFQSTVAIGLVPLVVVQPVLNDFGTTAGEEPELEMVNSIRFCRWRWLWFFDYDLGTIQIEGDRFHYRIPKSGFPSDTEFKLRVNGIADVSGGAIVDPGTEIEFSEDWMDPDYMISSPLFLVSDANDDQTFNGYAVGDNDLDDTTSLGSFGASVELVVSGSSKVMKVGAKPPIGVVLVKLKHLHDYAETQPYMIDDINQQFGNARDIYRQVGIELVQDGPIQTIVPTQTMLDLLGEDDRIDLFNEWFSYAPELWTYGSIGELTCVFSELPITSTHPPGSAIGWRYPIESAGGEVIGDLLMMPRNGDNLVLAHEIGHALNLVHVGPENSLIPYMLMSPALDVPDEDYTDQKRFSYGADEAIRTSIHFQEP